MRNVERKPLLLPPGQNDTGVPMPLLDVLPTVLMHLEHADRLGEDIAGVQQQK